MIQLPEASPDTIAGRPLGRLVEPSTKMLDQLLPPQRSQSRYGISWVRRQIILASLFGGKIAEVPELPRLNYSQSGSGESAG
jgi:hypothetical protein